MGALTVVLLASWLKKKCYYRREINRLKKIVSVGFLEKDNRTVVSSGVNYVVAPTLKGGEDADFLYLKNLGFNTVRVTTDRYGHKRSFHDSLNNAITLANAHGLHLISILPLGSIIRTVFNINKGTPPEVYKAIDFMEASKIAEATTLVEALVKPHSTESSIELWDLMNEPPNINISFTGFLKAMADVIRGSATQPVTIGIDKFEQFPYLADGCDVLSWHFYQFYKWDAEHPYDRLKREITELKRYDKRILISEFGFPTYYTEPSNIGNTPYKVPFITSGTRETLKLQRDYYANILHILKEEGITGYTLWQYIDGEGEGGAGWGIKREDGTEKPVVAVLP